MWTKKKKLLSLVIGILLLLLGYGIHYCWVSFPIITGYGAKVLCSSVFVSGRDEQQVLKEELGSFPLSLGHFSVDLSDSSVSGDVLGFAGKKAIYRSGLGVTLVSEWSEEKVRAERFALAGRRMAGTDSIPWPLGDRLADTLPAGLDTALLQRAMDSIFIERDTVRPMRTRAVVVLYKGQLVGERYGHGFSRSTRLLGWSMTKSITSALIGMLVKDGRLRVEAPAPVPEWREPGDPRHAITVEDLMQQCSGLQFVEDYSKYSDATRMLFDHADMGAYAASHPLKDAPGTVWYYSSGNSNILSRIIRQTVGEEGYHRFPYERLFHPMGMNSAVMEPDASGTFVGSSYMYATARDWARFGLLYLGDGVYNGQRLLPEGWVQRTVTPARPAARGQYGYQFWLNAGAKGNPADRLYPHVPTDMFCADGYEGQNVFIIPSRQLVVVRLGMSHGNAFDADRFLGEVLRAMP